MRVRTKNAYGDRSRRSREDERNGCFSSVIDACRRFEHESHWPSRTGGKRHCFLTPRIYLLFSFSCSLLLCKSSYSFILPPHEVLKDVVDIRCISRSLPLTEFLGQFFLSDLRNPLQRSGRTPSPSATLASMLSYRTRSEGGTQQSWVRCNESSARDNVFPNFEAHTRTDTVTASP